MIKQLFGLMLVASLLSSCLKTPSCPAEVPGFVAPPAEVAVIQAYVVANSLTAIQHPSGLFYIISNPGSGGSATQCSNITANYTGRLFGSLTNFDSGTSANFPMSILIAGWRIGIPLIQKGGSIRLLVPPSLGYGAAGFAPNIPGNAYLDFEIQIVDIR